MKKAIKTTKGIQVMTLEEAIMNYNGMVNSFAHQCVRMFSGISANILEFDDYKQMGLMDLMEAYKHYVDTKSCFSTYLTRVLKNRIVYYTKYFDVKKRKVENLYYYNNTFNESNGCEVSEYLETKMFSEEDEYFSNEKTDLEQFLLDSLTEEEKKYLTIEFNKRTKTSNEFDRKSFDHCFEVFGKEIQKEIRELSKTDFAKNLGISRPTLNTRINSTLNKAKKLVIEYKNKEVKYTYEF